MRLFDVNDFAFQKIAIRCETEEERDEFLDAIHEHWPEYMRHWPSYKPSLASCYVIGWDGNKFMQRATTPDSYELKSAGYVIITYKELCAMSSFELPALEELL